MFVPATGEWALSCSTSEELFAPEDAVDHDYYDTVPAALGQALAGRGTLARP